MQLAACSYVQCKGAAWIVTLLTPSSFPRVQTRATVILFEEPTIGPTNEDEDTSTEFENILSTGVPSSMVGWAIEQGKAVTT